MGNGKHSRINFNKKNKKRKIAVDNIIMLIAVVIFLVSGYQLLVWLKDNKQSKELAESILADVSITEVTNENNTIEIISPESSTEANSPNDYIDFKSIPLINVDFSNLLQKNSDTVAWLQVNGTDINYPVVQAADNDYYLTHAFDKSYNKSGWIYADYRNNMTSPAKNTIIYGHNRINSLMFRHII